MKSLVDLFTEGQYTLLQDELEHKLNNGHRMSMAEQLALHNNLSVCKWIRQQNTSIVNTQKENEFGRILFQCSSVLPSEEVLSVEVTALYNYVHSCLQESSNSVVVSSIVQSAIQRSLSRVLTYLCGESWTSGLTPANQPDLPSVWGTMLQCIWTALSIRKVSDELLLALCQCTWVLQIAGVHLGQATCMSSSIKSMTEALSMLQEMKVQDRKLLLTLHLHLDRQELSPLFSDAPLALCRDISRYLLAVCYCRTDMWTDGARLLDQITDLVCKGPASFLKGFCEFKTDQYIDSLSTLMEGVRTAVTMTTQLKARICNLMGVCFSQLDKFQLSLQMYKQALSVDFTYLLPLYQTATQFRRQGITDMELESLNLLVTALEMRGTEKPQADNLGIVSPGVVTLGCIDLLQLIDMDDEDVTYTQALYTLASRSLHCHRYDVSAEKYIVLLKHLQSWKSGPQDISSLPSLMQIHHETMVSLLNSGQFTECVHLCDTVLSSYHGDRSHDNTHDISCDVFSQEEKYLRNPQHQKIKQNRFCINGAGGDAFTDRSSCNVKSQQKNGSVDLFIQSEMSNYGKVSSQNTAEPLSKKRKYSEIREGVESASKVIRLDTSCDAKSPRCQTSVSVGVESQLRTCQSGTSQPGTSQPGISQSRTCQPGTSQSGTSQPGTSQSGTNQIGLRGEPVFDTDVMALKYKSEALVKTGDRASAIACLLSAVESLRRYKRQQLMTMSSRPSVSMAIDCDLVQCLGEKVLRVELDLYSKLGELLDWTEPGGVSSRHYKRLAAQVATALQPFDS